MDDKDLKPQNEELVPKQDESLTFLGDPGEQRAAEKREKTLVKRLRPIIVLAAVAVLLFVSVTVLQRVLPQKEGPIDPDDKTGISIFKMNGTSADRMEIKNDNDEFAFVKKVEKTYRIEGREDLPVANSSILGALTAFGGLTAATEVEKGVTDFEQFGLNDPVSTVKWIKGKESHYIELGALAPSGGYYLRVDGGDTVYTLATSDATYFVSPRFDFYDTALYSFSKDTDAAYLNYFSIYKKGGDKIEVRLQDLADDSLDSAFLMVEPIVHNFSVEKSDFIVSLVANLGSCTVYDDDLNPANLAKYGLDDPELTFEFLNVQERHTLRFGKLSDEGYRYMYSEGSPFVYIVDEDNINVLEQDVAYYCESMSYTRSYDTIDNLVISGGGKTYNIKITGTAENDDLKAYINEKYVEYENFGSLYAHIIGIEIKEVGSKDPDDRLIVTITVNCLDGTQDVIRYYKKSDVDCFFELNGEGRLIVSTAKVEQILTFAQKLYDGEEIVLDW